MTPAALALLLLLSGAAPVVAGELSYSGTVKTIDRATRTLVLDEVGPWKVVRGATQLTERTIALTPRTEILLVRRAPEGGAFPNDFVRTALAPADLAAGDFITARVAREGDRLVAVVITVVRPER